MDVTQRIGIDLNYQDSFHDLGDVTYVKRVSVGNINPNHPVTEEAMEAQMAELNQCLNSHPKGRIIGKDVSVGVYQMGEHQIIMQKITYHVGFRRKPHWLKDT